MSIQTQAIPFIPRKMTTLAVETENSLIKTIVPFTMSAFRKVIDCSTTDSTADPEPSIVPSLNIVAGKEIVLVTTEGSPIKIRNSNKLSSTRNIN